MSGEDRLDRPGPWRRRLLLGLWISAGAAIGVRAAQVQVVEGATWSQLADDQHRMSKEVVASRGAILDRDGTPLAVTRERFSVGIAPNEMQDADQVRDVLQATLDISSARAAYLTSSDRRWAVAPGRYAPTIREQLRDVPGVHLERLQQRYHPHGTLARGVLGVVIDDKGTGGIEQAFEQVLAGTPGREVVARDYRGREIPGERITVEDPRSGGAVVLTLDMDLQEIARQALREAMESTGAVGGDVLVTDPMTGEVLALVSTREGSAAALSAINTPYEPGSTLKPFTVAGLLEHDLASLSDSLDLEDGRWRVNGRTLTDVTKVEGRASLADALRNSSNVGIAKAAQAMAPGVQYENLRDFGFGVPTGIEIPGEVRGTLRRPSSWSGQSAASLAIGYEINVTPLQMAMAYGALANGGTLMQPRLVKEIRDEKGAVVEAFGPQRVRRVMDPSTARMISRVLVDAVDHGTGTRASLGTFRVAGKSGTSRLYSPDGGYEDGAYWSSFVGFFPADDPQLVVFVKLERPQDAYYGGAVAAPVTRATMEAALAARATPLDRGALVTREASRTQSVRSVAQFASLPIDPPQPPLADEDEVGTVLTLASGAVSVPAVAGLSARTAIRRLHALGLRVELPRLGSIEGIDPPPGARLLPGDTVRLSVRPAPSHE